MTNTKRFIVNGIFLFYSMGHYKPIEIKTLTHLFGIRCISSDQYQSIHSKDNQPYLFDAFDVTEKTLSDEQHKSSSGYLESDKCLIDRILDILIFHICVGRYSICIFITIIGRNMVSFLQFLKSKAKFLQYFVVKCYHHISPFDDFLFCLSDHVIIRHKSKYQAMKKMKPI